MFSRKFIYPFPCDGALSAHITGSYDDVSTHKSYYQKDKLDLIGKKIILQRHA